MLKTLYFIVLFIFLIENSYAKHNNGFLLCLEAGMNRKVACKFNKNYSTSPDHNVSSEILKGKPELDPIDRADIPQKAIIDLHTGRNMTGDYTTAHEGYYLKEQDILHHDGRKKISTGQNKLFFLTQLETDISEWQRKITHSLKNVLLDDLSKKFVKDMEDIRGLMSESVTLEEVYRRAREKEGQVIIPPQVDAVFLGNIKSLEKKSQISLLLKEFDKYKKLAAMNPGKMVSGNILLGAPDRSYFEPSEDAKRLSETGKAIEKVLEDADTVAEMISLLDNLFSAQSIPPVLHYQLITFHYIDVVGSGRFIYPNEPSDRYIYFYETLARQVIAMKQKSIQNPDALLKETEKVTEKEFRNYLEKLKTIVAEK